MSGKGKRAGFENMEKDTLYPEVLLNSEILQQIMFIQMRKGKK